MHASDDNEQRQDCFQLRKAEIVELLNRYVPAESDEAEHKRTILNFLRTARRPFDPRSFTPGHITGSALIFDDCDQKVLLIHHKRLNLWIQPGGHVAPDDRSIVETAIREAREEVGLQLPASAARLFDVDVHQIPAFGNDPQHLHFDFRFLIRCRQTAVDAMSDAIEACWFRLREAAEQAGNDGVKRLLVKCMELET
jgi:8-oxo-dGTP pyrophosphatase MutT (NUDIX family)